MNHKQRARTRLLLDEEMRHYRRAACNTHTTQGLLRAIRQSLNIPLDEIATRAGVSVSAVSGREEREISGSISLKALSRMARAMGCKVVYGIVPEGGKSLERLAEERMWARVLGVPQMSIRDIRKLLEEKYGPIN